MQDQGPDLARPIDRRGFLVTGAGALAVATSLGEGPAAAAQTTSKTTGSAVLPKRTLGRTGVEVTILNLGTWRSAGGERLLRYAWANGVRYFDTAKSYGSEPMIGRWLKAMPEARKQVFLVTKDHPLRTPRELIQQIDQRLAALQTDYVDLIFIHALGDHNFTTEVTWPKSKEFKETAEAIRKSHKAKFVGFSTHHPRRPQILQAAAEGGFVDVIMLQNNPWIAQEDNMNRALDACHRRGIGLISMKQVAGNMNLDEIGRQLPELREKGLTPYQALLHAIWTDERFSSVCVSMRNTDQVRENTEAARTFKPMTKAEIHRLRDACIAAGPTMCASCDGRCSQAAGTTAELGNLTRFLTYHNHHGYRSEARRLYAELDVAARDWHGADLDAARQACPNHLDFAKLLPRADQLLG
jgi:aryl-alcohol dehydrogenase-like predicted oxidoreductase